MRKAFLSLILFGACQISIPVCHSGNNMGFNEWFKNAVAEKCKQFDIPLNPKKPGGNDGQTVRLWIYVPEDGVSGILLEMSDENLKVTYVPAKNKYRKEVLSLKNTNPNAIKLNDALIKILSLTQPRSISAPEYLDGFAVYLDIQSSRRRSSFLIVNPWAKSSKINKLVMEIIEMSQTLKNQ